jgi:hypothetical protein
MCRLARNEESPRSIDELVLSLNDARELAANEDALQGKGTEGQQPLAPATRLTMEEMPMIDTSSKLSRRSLLAGMVAVPALASAAVAAERPAVKSVEETQRRP